METVSIIIPCYNDGDYLMEAIASALAQTYPYLQIIVIDDGSTNASTVEKLALVESADITLVRTKNKGPAAARNEGIRHASGKYIFPLDADDKIDSTYIEKAVKAMETNPECGIVYCRARMFGLVDQEWDLPTYSLRDMLLDNIIFVSALFTKADWRAVGGFPEDCVAGLEDYDFWLSLIERGCAVIQIPETLFFYRIKGEKSHNHQLAKNTEALIAEHMRVFNRHKALFLAHGEDLIPSMKKRILMLEHTPPTNPAQSAGWIRRRVGEIIRNLRKWKNTQNSVES